MNDLVAITVAALGLVGSLGGAFLVMRRGQKSDSDTNKLTERRDEVTARDGTIKDLRAEVARMVARIDMVDAHAENRIRDAEKRSDDRIEKLEQEQARFKRREHIRDDYINDLRNHIETGLGPPAPPWPKNLYEF